MVGRRTRKCVVNVKRSIMRKLKYAYIFRRDFENPGDLYSCPMHYLTKDKHGIMIDVYDDNVPEMEVDVVIVGGGAIFSNNKFISSIDNILEKVKSKYRIAWGVGLTSSIKHNIKSNFDLFGCRDFTVENQFWTPCLSVLHPLIFENLNKIPKNKFLVVDHWKRPIHFPRNHTRIFNKPNNIETVIQAISNHKRIFTSSFHVAYWATLLKRKVYVIGDNLPGKFFTMKHSPVIAENYTDDLLNQGTVYYDAYENCVDENKKFRTAIEQVVGEKIIFANPKFN